MAKTLIGNIKGKDGRGITSIEKTGTTGSVDTYTITYTDSTTSTFTINNSDSISLQRQIVPSAAVESSATASQAYAAGDYVVVNGVLRKVTAAIAKGNSIGDSNSTATTVSGELATLGDSVSRTKLLWSGSATLGSTFSVPGIAGCKLISVVCSNSDANWWPVLCSVGPRHNDELLVYVNGSLRINNDYRVDICSKLTLADDWQTVHFENGGQFSLVKESGTVTKQKLRVVAIYSLL